MQTPKKSSDVDAWFKGARKVIPEIPNNWMRPEPIITEKTILFELVERETRDKCAVIIDRTPE